MADTREIIGWDLDNVLSPSAVHFVEDSNARWGLSLSVDDYHEDWPRLWGCEVEEARLRAAVIQSPEVMSSYRPTPGAPEMLERLHDRYRHVVTTSRPAVVQECTIEWVKEHYDGIFEGVFFAGMWDEVCEKTYDAALQATKAPLYQKLGVSRTVDDEPKHCRGALAVGVEPALFGDYAWNRHVDVPQGVVRIPDLSRLEAHLADTA